MICYALTELGIVLKLEVVEESEEDFFGRASSKIIENAVVLDTDKSTFSIKYSPKYGEIISDTITENPENVYNRLAKARNEIEKREIAFMTNLFLLNKNVLHIKNKENDESIGE